MVCCLSSFLCSWAIVKNAAVAERMTQYIVRNTVGVSHDTQNRAAVLLRATFKGYEDCERNRTFYSKDLNDLIANCKFFHYGNSLMASRWERVRAALAGNAGFSLPQPNPPDGCTFLGTYFSTHPGKKYIIYKIQIYFRHLKQIFVLQYLISHCQKSRPVIIIL